MWAGWVQGWHDAQGQWGGHGHPSLMGKGKVCLLESEDLRVREDALMSPSSPQTASRTLRSSDVMEALGE